MKVPPVFSSAAAIAAAVVAASAFAATDVGLVNMLSGEVRYASEGAARAKVQPFMKLREGDRIEVSAGAQLQVVYFDGGREETWKGPAVFRAGARESRALSGQPITVKTLPAAVPMRIAQVPELLQIARLGRSGGVQVRGTGQPPRLTPEQQAEVNSAKETYRKMRAESSADDITPELYLYSVLQDYLLYEDMKPVVDEMVKRQPQSKEVQELATWVNSRAQR